MNERDEPLKKLINNNINFDEDKNDLVNENKKLKEQLNNYKREKENLKNEINKLKEDNNKLNNEIMNYKNIIDNLNIIKQNNQENIKMISNLNELILIKDKEINELKLKLKDSGNKNKLINNDDLIFVHFISINEKMDYGIKCLKTDTFAEVEEKLYKKYEEYRETNNNFCSKGKMILRFKKISENNIQDGGKIYLINNKKIL